MASAGAEVVAAFASVRAAERPEGPLLLSKA